MPTFLALMLLPLPHGDEGSTASEDLMAERGLVGVLALVVLLLSVVWERVLAGEVLRAGSSGDSEETDRIPTCLLVCDGVVK